VLIAVLVAIIVVAVFLVGVQFLNAGSGTGLHATVLDPIPSDSVTTESATTANPSSSTRPGADASGSVSGKPKPSKTPPATAAVEQPSPSAATTSPAPLPTGPSAVPIAPRTSTVLATSGRCLDDLSSVTSEGNPIQTWPCNRTQAQSFTFGTDGTLRVFDRCLRPASGSAAAGTLIQLRACDGTFRTWSYRSDRTIFNADSGLCLTEPTTTTEGRYLVSVNTCDGRATQKWNLS
jgi:hypothetical protein